MFEGVGETVFELEGVGETVGETELLDGFEALAPTVTVVVAVANEVDVIDALAEAESLDNGLLVAPIKVVNVLKTVEVEVLKIVASFVVTGEFDINAELKAEEEIDTCAVIVFIEGVVIAEADTLTLAVALPLAEALGVRERTRQLTTLTKPFDSVDPRALPGTRTTPAKVFTNEEPPPPPPALLSDV